MLGRVINPKYLDPGIPVVNISINKIPISSILMDLGATLNVMKKDTMLDLNLQSFIMPTTNVLQLADTSTVRSEGKLEDIIINIESCKYPTDFVVIEAKTKLVDIPSSWEDHE